MFRAFTGVLALALALLVLNWFFPELVRAIIDVALKVLQLISAIISLLLKNLPAQ